ncbi:MAG: TrmH family RNA methyltransferase [Bacteroidia bacterium]
MLSAACIKNINRLHQKKFRKELGSFIVEGPKVVAEFLHSDIKITEIYGLAKWISSNKAVLNEKKCVYEVISEAELSRISGLQTPNEVFAICDLPDWNESKIEKSASLFLYLDGIADPGNMGTIIRMAEWYGLNQVFMSDASAEVYSPKVVQSSMGSVARMKCFYLPIEKLLQITGKAEVWGADLKGENIYAVSLPGKCILAIGSESHGISSGTRKTLTKTISIPSAQASKTESLNAAVATSVILSEIFRKSNFSE